MTSGNNITPDKSQPEPQFKSLENMYAGWDLEDKDLVNYRDAQRRGLQFMFSAIRKSPSNIIDSPVNKVVSVYQKNEEGDFVIVSKSGNNPNDIRVMEMTNEYYGDPEPDPMYFINKVIEMADDSGMIRDISEYGTYGMIETADDLHNNFRADMGKEPEQTKTSSKVTEAQQANSKQTSGKPKSGKLDKILNILGGAFSFGGGLGAASGSARIVGPGQTVSGTKSFINAFRSKQEKDTFVEKSAIIDKQTQAKENLMAKKYEYDAQLLGYKHGFEQEQLSKKLTVEKQRDIGRENVGLKGIESKERIAKMQNKTRNKEVDYKYNILSKAQAIKKVKGDISPHHTPNVTQQFVDRVAGGYDVKPQKGPQNYDTMQYRQVGTGAQSAHLSAEIEPNNINMFSTGGPATTKPAKLKTGVKQNSPIQPFHMTNAPQQHLNQTGKSSNLKQKK